MEIVYLETTFFSFYHDERPASAIVAMRDWTRQFWDERRDDYSLVTSAAVLDELRKGGAHHKKPALDLALTLPLIPGGNEVAEIVQAYVKHKIMPADPAGDALHLALAFVPRMRLSCNVELPASGERQQVWPHPADQHHAGIENAGIGDAAGITGKP
jgi:hypothetical protein